MCVGRRSLASVAEHDRSGRAPNTAPSESRGRVVAGLATVVAARATSGRRGDSLEIRVHAFVLRVWS
jgi:hypothetical protein